ncbi:MAG: CaiB/BaiF CoA transferase family protein [bacterium]
MRPLDGLLVVAVEQAVAAPLCTARLREGGARVIKIERPGGDFARNYDAVAGGDSSYFLWLNHGKESLELNLKDAADAALLHRIVARADVLVQNLAPGALRRAGFDSAQLRARHPRLITCDISGYGDDDAGEAMKAYDFLVQGESGLIGVSGGADQVGRIGVSICDIGAGMAAHAGILEALLRRAVNGRGGGVEMSLFAVAAEWMCVPLLHHDCAGRAPPRARLHHPSIAPYGGYRCADGETVLIAIQNEREWQRFCAHVLQRADAASQYAFNSNNARVANRVALDAIINEVVGALHRADFIARLRRADIAYGALNSVADLSAHPALRRTAARASSGAVIELPAPPIAHSNDAPADDRGREIPEVPHVGAHNAAIRHEFAEAERAQA